MSCILGHTNYWEYLYNVLNLKGTQVIQLIKYYINSNNSDMQMIMEKINRGRMPRISRSPSNERVSKKHQFNFIKLVIY